MEKYRGISVEPTSAERLSGARCTKKLITRRREGEKRRIAFEWTLDEKMRRSAASMINGWIEEIDVREQRVITRASRKEKKKWKKKKIKKETRLTNLRPTRIYRRTKELSRSSENRASCVGDTNTNVRFFLTCLVLPRQFSRWTLVTFLRKFWSHSNSTVYSAKRYPSTVLRNWHFEKLTSRSVSWLSFDKTM